MNFLPVLKKVFNLYTLTNKISRKINNILITTIHPNLIMVKDLPKTQITQEHKTMLYHLFRHLDLTPVLKIILKQTETMGC
jgi:hypothetical protein